MSMIYLTRRMKLYFKDRASWSSSIFRALGTYSYFGLVVQWMTTTIVPVDHFLLSYWSTPSTCTVVLQ